MVATPGRLLDLVGRNAIQLDDVDLLVLDEADRLLDEGFADELARLIALLPARRQSLFFSATFPPAVQTIWRRRCCASRCAIDGGRAAAATPTRRRARSSNARSRWTPPQRTPLLRHLIEKAAWPRVLVFVATRYASEHVAEKLRRAGLAAAAFHGDLSQGARTRVLADLNSGALRVLLATDIAARGLDIPGLPVVVNYDLPRSAVDYTHRIGRTARAGAAGLAVSFVSAASEAHFRLIEKRQGQRVPRERIAGFEPRETRGRRRRRPTAASRASARARRTSCAKPRQADKQLPLRAARRPAIDQAPRAGPPPRWICVKKARPHQALTPPLPYFPEGGLKAARLL